MPGRTVNVSELFAGYNILLGGIGPTMEVYELSADEQALLNKFLDETSSLLREIEPILADMLVSHRDLIFRMAEIFKAKVNGKSFGGEPPTPGTFGIALLAPYDLHYTDTPSDTEPAYTAYGKGSWVLSVTAGTEVYLLGDATHFFKMSPTVGKRTMGLIFQNGIIEVGTTPGIDQFKVDTEKVTYAPFRAVTFEDLPIDPRKPIYIYKTPFAIPLWYDFGIKLAAMPKKSGDVDLRLFGVVFYEYDYHSTLKATA